MLFNSEFRPLSVLQYVEKWLSYYMLTRENVFILVTILEKVHEKKMIFKLAGL